MPIQTLASYDDEWDLIFGESFKHQDDQLHIYYQTHSNGGYIETLVLNRYSLVSRKRIDVKVDPLTALSLGLRVLPIS